MKSCAQRKLQCLILVFSIMGTSIASTAAAAGQCKLRKFAELPVTMVDRRPLMTARINDTDVQLIVDSGAFYSFLTEASAAQLKLETAPSPLGPYVDGVHGAAAASITTVKTFALAGGTLHDVEFLVTGGELGHGSVGALGQDFLHLGDAEYDLGHGMIRLMKPENCEKTLLAYWAKESEAYSEINLASEPPLRGSSTGSHLRPKELQLSHIMGRAYVNDVEIRVVFDTGAASSILSLSAAARAGIKPDSPGVIRAASSSGIGKGTFATYIAPVSSFRIGDEETKNTRLRIGGIDLSGADMLVGADFFLSHRIFVANSQRKMYFTYNGGPVFDLTRGSHPVSETSEHPSETAASASGQESAAAASTDSADDFARRGAAFASRREFDQALTDLARACELAPDNPEYAYLRGTVYWQLKQVAAAKAEYDRSLKLKPNDLPTLIAHAQLSVRDGDNTAAVADLDAADAAAPKGADARFQLAHGYAATDRLAPAVAQLTLWIESHAADSRMPEALNSRCWLRALEGVDLPLALEDCNAALKHAAKSSPFYAKVSDSRGLLFLRMADYGRSIADYDAALKINAKNAWSLYGRGMDELRKHETAAGNADIASATAASPDIAEEFKRRGIMP